MSQATLKAIPCLTLTAGELTAAELSSLPLAKPSSKSKNPREPKQPREAKHPQQVAEEFVEALSKVNEAAIPVMSRERNILRKERAKLTRQLFKKLGLKGASVTTPNYSMAHVVEVDLPGLEIHAVDMWPHDQSPDKHSNGLQLCESKKCPACRQNRKTREKVDEILARAFPNNDDRSDTMSDYFDYCWSLSCKGW